MKTQQATQRVNYVEGEQILQKAIISEKDSRRYYGMYIQWAAKHHVPLDVITGQLIKVKGWSISTARKYSKAIMLLSEADNLDHLEALLHGEISFEVATMRVTPTSPRNIVYNDEETAGRYLQRAFTIMLHRNKTWKHRELLDWTKDILDKFIANLPSSSARS
jgi:hypothetical protein